MRNEGRLRGGKCRRRRSDRVQSAKPTFKYSCVEPRPRSCSFSSDTCEPGADWCRWPPRSKCPISTRSRRHSCSLPRTDPALTRREPHTSAPAKVGHMALHARSFHQHPRDCHLPLGRQDRRELGVRNTQSPLAPVAICFFPKMHAIRL